MTQSELKHLHVARDPRGVLTVSLNVCGRAMNVFCEEAIFELQTLVGEVEHDTTVRLIVFRSEKESGFLAGADVREIREIRDAQTAEEILVIGQNLFDRVQRLPVPTVAVIHGPCLGAGLEFALACRYRLARDDSQTRLGLPEVELGLLPGWGGLVRLPQQIGLSAALPMLLAGRKVSAREALALGLVDAIWPPREFEEGVRWFLADRLADKPLPRRQPSLLRRLRDQTAWGQRAVLGIARRQTARRAQHYPALPAILGAVRETIRSGRASGLSRSRTAFVQLLFSPACRNLLELFLQREAARRRSTWVPDATSAPVRRIAIIGAGTMGAGIAQLAAMRGVGVVLKDIDQRVLEKGLRRIEALMDTAQRKGLVTEGEAAARRRAITATTSWQAVEGADLAIEAVPEREDLKLDVFGELDRRLPPHALLVTNTSALPVGRLAAATQRPDRVAGLHFFNPVHRMPLVEIVRAATTGDAAVATLVDAVRSWGKVPLVVADQPGFLVNRILFPYLDEAVRMVCEGVSPARVDRGAKEFGMPMGPLELLDQVGIDVAADVSRTLGGLTPESSPTPDCFAKMVARGWTGLKAGRGFYMYRRGRRGKPAAGDVSRAGSLSESSPRAAAVDDRQRLVCAMLNEAARCLQQQVVREPWMVDLGMVLGTGFAPFHGGPLRLADAWGLARVVAELKALEQACGPRFAPCVLLEEMSNNGRSFYPERELTHVQEASEEPLPTSWIRMTPGLLK